jgi:hypothetical protein
MAGGIGTGCGCGGFLGAWADKVAIPSRQMKLRAERRSKRLVMVENSVARELRFWLDAGVPQELNAMM